jgi:hypothetical protein
MRKVPITPLGPAVLEFRLTNNWHVLTPVLTCGLAHSFSTFGRIWFWYWRVCYLSWQFQPCKGGGACLPAILSQASDREIDGGREGFRTKSHSSPWYLGWRGWRLGACQVRALRALFGIDVRSPLQNYWTMFPVWLWASWNIKLPMPSLQTLNDEWLFFPPNPGSLFTKVEFNFGPRDDKPHDWLSQKK